MTTPLHRLLDLDAGRLPRLIVRIDGRDVRLIEPERLSLADALRLGDLLQTLAADDTPPARFDAVAQQVVAIVGPAIALQPATVPADAAPPPDALPPGAARRIVAFYAEQLADAVEQLAAEGAPLPFSTGDAPGSTPPASPLATAAASGSS